MRRWARLSKGMVALTSALGISGCTYLSDSIDTAWMETAISPGPGTGTQGGDAGRSFMVLPLEPQAGHPEFDRYANRIAQNMMGLGYARAYAIQNASLAVYLDPGLTDGCRPTHDDVGAGQRQGLVGRALDLPSAVEDAPFRCVVTISVVDLRRSTARRPYFVFEGQTATPSWDGVFGSVAPCLIDAMFADFPGTSSYSRPALMVRCDGEGLGTVDTIMGYLPRFGQDPNATPSGRWPDEKVPSVIRY